MGQKQSTTTLNTVVQILSEQLKKTGSNSATDQQLMAMMNDQNSSLDFLPDRLSDVLVLFQTAAAISFIVFFIMMNKRLRSLETETSNESRFIKERVAGAGFKRITRTADETI
ncbi:hypothetical protein CDIK_4536 [Cucumispora dikerogammari]|nr:hypothetical protein CDIK_4536 [Cucumispora dikerogammari]